MKHILNKTSLALAAAGWLAAGLAHADIPLPIPASVFLAGDGSLVYNNSAVPTNICIDLSKAVTGVWSNAQVGTNIGRNFGTYDPEQWAVVFKYISVNIGANATLCFTNHPSHAPVVWIVQGDVRIDGRVNLDGEPGNTFARHTEPGPGGGYGGIGETSEVTPASDGFGWGGGLQNTVGGPGSFSSQGAITLIGNSAFRGVPGLTYGTASCVPLRGGSGGSSPGELGDINFANNRSMASGGAGGGAIAIFSGRTILINGLLSANGGALVQATSYGIGIGGGGSGGSIRLLAEAVGGVGSLFRGWLDELMVFDRALTAAEAAALYQADSAGVCRP